MRLLCKNTTIKMIWVVVFKNDLPESFNTNISRQLFDYKITFVNSQRENTNSKGDFVLKNLDKTFALKISCIQKLI